MSENLKITIAALLSVAGVFGFILVLQWVSPDWEKWFVVAYWTAFVFGIIAGGAYVPQ